MYIVRARFVRCTISAWVVIFVGNACLGADAIGVVGSSQNSTRVSEPKMKPAAFASLKRYERDLMTWHDEELAGLALACDLPQLVLVQICAISCRRMRMLVEAKRQSLLAPADSNRIRNSSFTLSDFRREFQDCAASIVGAEIVFRLEVERQLHQRRRLEARVAVLLDQLTEVLSLSEKQQTRLRQSLGGWDRIETIAATQLLLPVQQEFDTGQVQLPDLPDSLVLPFLNQSQRELWGGTVRYSLFSIQAAGPKQDFKLLHRFLVDEAAGQDPFEDEN